MHTFPRLYSPVLFDLLESDFTYRKKVGGRSTHRKLLRCDLAQTSNLLKTTSDVPQRWLWILPEHWLYLGTDTTFANKTGHSYLCQ